MTASRFHHLTVCVMCVVLCFLAQTQTAFLGWQWWLLYSVAIYASQPLLNACWRFLALLLPKRAPADPYALIRPIVK